MPNESNLVNTHQDDLLNINSKDSIKVSNNDSTHYSTGIYFQGAFGHYIKNRISLFHALTYYSQENSHIKGGFRAFDLPYSMIQPALRHHFSAHDPSKTDDVNKQYQYYLNANIPLKHGWNISSAVHFLSSHISHTGYHYDFGTPPKPWSPVRVNENSSSASTYFVGSYLIGKSIGGLKISFVNTFSNISNVKRYQNNLSFQYYPLGNNRLILGCDGYFLKNLDTALTRFAFNGNLTVRPFKTFSITAGYLVNTKDYEQQNQSNNVIEGNGYLINNSSDKTHSRFSLTGNVEIGKHLDVFVAYSYEVKSAIYPASTAIAETQGPGQNQTTTTGTNTEIPYFYNNIFFGITFKNFSKTNSHKN
jgi:hypothetical protein